MSRTQRISSGCRCRAKQRSVLAILFMLGLLCCIATVAHADDQADLRDARAELARLIDEHQAIYDKFSTTERNTPEYKQLVEAEARLRQQVLEAGETVKAIGDRIDRASLQRLRDRSLMIKGVAPANGLTKLLYASYRESVAEVEDNANQGLLPLHFEIEGSADLVQQLIDGETSMIVTDRSLTDEEQQALANIKPSDEQESLPLQSRLARAVVVVLVHQRNPVKELTIEQLEQVYRDPEGNWKQHNGWDRPIDRLGTCYPLLSWNLFNTQVLGGKRVKWPNKRRIDPSHLPNAEELDEDMRRRLNTHPGSGPFPRYRDDAKVAGLVSENTNAIGYCLLPFSGELPDAVRALKIATEHGKPAYAPTKEHVLLDEYPLQQTLWLIVQPDASKQANAFAAFALSDAGNQIITSAGLHPLNERDDMLVARRLAAYRRGEGQRVSAVGGVNSGKLLRELAMKRTMEIAPLHIDFSPTSEMPAVQAFLDGEREMLLLEGDLSDRTESLHGERLKTLDAKHVAIGGRAVALIVNAKNPIAALTPEQVQQIFHGENKTWQSVNEAQGDIQLYALPGNHPATQLLYAKAIDQRKRTRMDYKRDDAEVIKAVMFDEQGLGYVDLAALKDEHIAAEDGQPGLRILAIGSGEKAVAPAVGTISDGTYPYAQRLTLLVSPKASDAAKSFVRFITSHDFDSVFREHGFLQAEPTDRKEERSATTEATGALGE